MASAITQVTFRAGRTAGIIPWFNSSGRYGDWQTIHVPFDPFMPAGAEGKVRVVASANGDDVPAAAHIAATVPLIGEVSHMGFTAWVRNSDISAGYAGLSWLAVAEVPDAPSVSPPRLRSGTTQPQHFQTDGLQGDWRRWAVSHGSRIGFIDIPTCVVTATNNNVRVHAAASVGAVSGSSLVGFNVAARNSDIGPGASSFNFIAILPDSNGNPDLFVDTGQVPARYFAVENYPGDWQVWAVNFAEPFSSPPIVLATADNSNGQLNSYARAVVGVVFDVSCDGFTLAGRNSDLCAGPAGFSWVAVGRAQ